MICGYMVVEKAHDMIYRVGVVGDEVEMKVVGMEGGKDHDILDQLGFHLDTPTWLEEAALLNGINALRDRLFLFQLNLL